jgi:hypothetical protein
MTLLAERARARTELVAASHSLRLVIVTVLIPFAFNSGLQGWSAPAWPVRGCGSGAAWPCWPWPPVPARC